MEQNTSDWLKWRNGGIGGSDAPIIMGESPFMTAYQLWEIKTGLVTPSDESNFIFEKGHRLEKVARAKFEFETDKTWPPKLCEHSSVPYFRASLDGFNVDNWECKYVGKEDFEAGVVPSKYYPQLQHQMMVSGAETCYLTMINDEKEITTMAVPVSEEYILNRLAPTLHAFWKLVQSKTPPELNERDSKKIGSNKLKALIEEYKILTEKIKPLAAQVSIKKEEIFSLITHPKMNHGNVNVLRYQIQGRVNYKNIPELEKVDLNKHRGEPSIGHKISIKKEKDVKI